MKANLKGQGGVKGLLLLHGEKIGMAVVGVCAVMFIFFSLRQERLRGDHGPENLTRRIHTTQEAIRQYKWEQAPERGVAQPLKDIADIAVQADKYPIAARGWNPPVVPPSVLRTDPVLLPAEDVVGRGGSGLLAFADEKLRQQRLLESQAAAAREAQAREKEAAKQPKDETNRRRSNRGNETTAGAAGAKQSKERPAGGDFLPEGVALSGDERVELAYWACVVAKVPVGNQLHLYRDVFENARGSEQADEVPVYQGFFVQRAEVRPGQALQWEPVAVYDGQGNEINKAMAVPVIRRVVQDWAEVTEEKVDDKYLDPMHVLVYPLPPLVGRDWGDEVTHPDIPLASDADGQPAQNEVPTDTAAPNGAKEGANTQELFGAAATPPEAGGLYPRAGMPPGVGPRVPMASGLHPGYYAPRPGGMSYPQPDMSYPAADRRAGLGAAGRTVLPPNVEDYLLRFFDFNVQPGKKYKYRVRLVLADPNHGISRDWLDPSVVDRIEKEGGKSYRLTDWSSPSATIGIPDAGSVRVVDARSPSDKLYNDEPRVNLLVESYDVDDKTGQAMQAQLEKEFRRGYVANMTEDAEILVDRNRYIEPVDGFKFQTGITVLDIRGGDRLSRDVSQPASALLMSSAGQLSIRNELNDADDVKRFHTIFDKDNTRRGRKTSAEDRYRGPSLAPGGGAGFQEGYR